MRRLFCLLCFWFLLTLLLFFFFQGLVGLKYARGGRNMLVQSAKCRAFDITQSRPFGPEDISFEFPHFLFLPFSFFCCDFFFFSSRTMQTVVTGVVMLMGLAVLRPITSQVNKKKRLYKNFSFLRFFRMFRISVVM